MQQHKRFRLQFGLDCVYFVVFVCALATCSSFLTRVFSAPLIYIYLRMYMSGGINSIQCCFSIGLLQVEKENGFFKSTFDLFKSIRFRYPRGCRHLQVNAQVVVATKHDLETSEQKLKKVENQLYGLLTSLS